MIGEVKFSKSIIKLPVYIIAGGRSTRFGSDKTRAMVHGKPLIVRVVEQFRPIASKVTVVSDVVDRYQDLGLDTIADTYPSLGPLAGIQSALSHHGSGGWILCASADRIGIRLEWLIALLSNTSTDLDVVAYRGSFWQPFPALYRGAMESLVNRAISGGITSPWKVIQSVRARGLRLPRDWENSLDVNDERTLRRWCHG